MTSIEETKRNIRILFKAQPEINLSLVYNREFFQGMGLENVRIHSSNAKKPEDPDIDKTQDQVKIPSPKDGWFKRIQMYINPFISSANEDPMYKSILNTQKLIHTQTSNHDIIVLLPKHKFQVVPLKTFLFHRRNVPSIYHYKNSGLDFFHIQNFIKDTMQQMEYMKIKGLFIKSFSIESFILINERMFFIDPKRIEFLSSDKDFNLSVSAFLAFFQKSVLQGEP